MKKSLLTVLFMMVVGFAATGFTPVQENVNSGKYFIIQVLSCDVPYPGITVYVQDPNGNNLTFVSDANGQVIISDNVPGLYSIEASDGWSTQLDSWFWDGKKNKQVKNVPLDC